jgi:transcriptional regulator with XRE-family HTH domain
MAQEIVKRIAANVRGLREEAALSLSELARRSGLSKGALSQLEAAQANPTVETLWSLAQALGVPFSDLTLEAPPPATQVIHADDGEWITGDPISSRLLHRLAVPGVLEIHQIRIHPGRARRSDAHLHGLTEHVVVHTGRMRVGPAEEPVLLTAGDAASYLADCPHVYEALEPDTTGLILMSYPTLRPRTLPSTSAPEPR